MKDELLSEIMKNIKTDKEAKDTQKSSTPINHEMKMNSERDESSVKQTYMKVFCYCGTEILPQDKYEREQGLCEDCLVKVYKRPKQDRVANRKIEQEMKVDTTANINAHNRDSTAQPEFNQHNTIQSKQNAQPHKVNEDNANVPEFLKNDNANKPLNSLNIIPKESNRKNDF